MLAALLLLPPILPFFDRPVAVLGLPLIIVYVFGVWLALIAMGLVLSRRLPADVTRGVPPSPVVKDVIASGRTD